MNDIFLMVRKILSDKAEKATLWDPCPGKQLTY
jgi:hypothetical protein